MPLESPVALTERTSPSVDQPFVYQAILATEPLCLLVDAGGYFAVDQTLSIPTTLVREFYCVWRN